MGLSLQDQEVLEGQLQMLLAEESISLAPIGSGRNNQSFVIDTGEERCFGKRYFSGEKNRSDGERRQEAEWRFLAYLKSINETEAPAPIAVDWENGISVMTYFEGSRFVNPIELSDARSALDFWSRINSRGISEEYTFGRASDSCLSLEEHLLHVERRVSRLLDFTQSVEGVGDLKEWLDKVFSPFFQRSRDAYKARCSKSSDYRSILPKDLQVLSPSDFGFHNAIRKDSGGVVYFDYEYAGWDDPLKVVCDFFAQPDYPIPCELIDYALQLPILSKVHRDARELVSRLMPLYLCKWVCIILNPVFREKLCRREFAGVDENLAVLIDRAACYLQKHPFGIGKVNSV